MENRLLVFIAALCFFALLSAETIDIMSCLDNAVAANDINQVKSLCLNYCMEQSTNDVSDEEIRCRYLLSKIAVAEDDLHGIYGSYCFFDHMNSLSDEYDFTATIEELLQAYDQLVEDDIMSPISEGVYFSEECNSKGMPEIVLNVKLVNGRWQGRLIDGCGITDVKSKREYDITPMSVPCEITVDDEQYPPHYFMAYNGRRVMFSNAEAANQMFQASHDLQRESRGAIYASDMNFRNTVLSLAVTNVTGGLMDGFATMVSQNGRVLEKFVTLEWVNNHDGTIVLAVMEKKYVRRANSVKEESQCHRYILNKLYPHHQMILGCEGRRTKGILVTASFPEGVTKKSKNAKSFYQLLSTIDAIRFNPIYHNGKSDEVVGKSAIEKIMKMDFKCLNQISLRHFANIRERH